MNLFPTWHQPQRLKAELKYKQSLLPQGSKYPNQEFFRSLISKEYLYRHTFTPIYSLGILYDISGSDSLDEVKESDPSVQLHLVYSRAQRIL